MADLALDLDQRRTDARAAREFVASLRAWAQAGGLTGLYSATERRLFDRDPATWTSQEVVDATWSHESIGTLLWALWEYEALPGYDAQFEGVGEAIPMLAPTHEFVM